MLTPCSPCLYFNLTLSHDQWRCREPFVPEYQSQHVVHTNPIDLNGIIDYPLPGQYLSPLCAPHSQGSRLLINPKKPS